MKIKDILSDNASLTETNRAFDLYRQESPEGRYFVYLLSKKFSKYQNIFLNEDGSVAAEFMYLFGGLTNKKKKKKVLCKPTVQKGIINLVVYRGKPNTVHGLDDGVFSSYRPPLSTQKIYFISEAELCAFFEKDRALS